MNESLLQLGGVTAICALLIREVFAFLKSRKNGNGEIITADVKVLDELRMMNNNHLHSIEKAITDGNKDIVRVIGDGNIKMVELLGEIKGSLKSR